jgi:molybdate transport system substrate-binding protein
MYRAARPKAGSGSWWLSVLVVVPGILSAQPVTILHAESIADNVLVRTVPTAAGRDRLEPSDSRLALRAFGREFHALLEHNDRLVHALDANAREMARQVELYRGELTGLPGSWVRVSRYRNELTGLFWDGRELYVIEPHRRVAPLLYAPLPPRGASVVYRLSDTTGPLSDFVLHPDEADLESLAAALSMPSGSGSIAANLPSGYPSIMQLDIGLIADHQFWQREGEESAPLLLSMANMIDGIYTEQLGVHIRVAELEVHREPSSALSATDPVQLLDQMGQYKAARPTLAGQGLAHLFTGRTLGNHPTTGAPVAGIAYLGALCEIRHGVAVTQVASHHALGFAALIAAHEIGHNFGAPHDGQPGPCALTPPTFLMAATLAGSDTLSQCSIEQMRPHIAAAGCLRPPPLTDVAISAISGPASLGLGEAGQFVIAIDNLGSQEAFDLTVEVTADGLEVTSVTDQYRHSASCDPAPDLPGWRCYSRRLPAGQSDQLSVTASGAQNGIATLAARVYASNDTNAGNDHAETEVTVAPAVIFRITDVTPPDSPIKASTSTFGAIEYTNEGLMEATGVQVELAVHGDRFEFVDLQANGRGCPAPDSVPGQHVVRHVCEVGVVPPGATVRLEFLLTAKSIADLGEVGRLSAMVVPSISADEPDLDQTHMQFMMRVVRAFADLQVAGLGPFSMRLDDEGTWTVEVRNLGPDVATGVTISFSNSMGNMTGADTPQGWPCSVDAGVVVKCIVEHLAVDESVKFTYSLTALELGTFWASASAYFDEHDPSQANNVWSREFGVLPQPPPPVLAPPAASSPPAGSGGGGSGAMDAGLLLALLGLGLLAHLRSKLTSSGRYYGACGATALLTLLFTFASPSPVLAQDGPAIAAASDLQFALDEIAAQFTTDTGQPLRLVYGSSGNFARQIEQGAPYELYLSADEAFVFRLADRGFTRDHGTLYAIGRIVLFTPHGSRLGSDDGLAGVDAALERGAIRRFAIANPEHAPYGRAAEQALRHIGLWERLRPHLVYGENVSQAAQFAVSGNSQGGIIAYSLALAPSVRQHGGFALIPEEWHEPLRQRMVLTRTATPEAEAFYDYMQAEPARVIMRRFGFVLPEE